MTLDAVVFDVGGVLIDWDPRYLYRKLLPGESGMELFLSTVCTPRWNDGLDRGQDWDEAVAELCAMHPDRADLIQAYHDRWPEMCGDAIWEMVDILHDLVSRDVPVYAITNFARPKFDIARRMYPFLGLFQGMIVSGDEGIAKPDPEIFHRFLARFTIPAERLLFIDDRPENVRAACAAGFQGIVYTSPASVREILVREGVL